MSELAEAYAADLDDLRNTLAAQRTELDRAMRLLYELQGENTHAAGMRTYTTAGYVRGIIRDVLLNYPR